MTIIKNNLLKFQNYAFIIIIFCIPKIDLIDIPNYHQGIRLEDILLYIIFFILLLSKKLFFKREDIGSNFILFFPYLCFVYIISFYIIDRVPSLVIIIRYLQYIVLLTSKKSSFTNFEISQTSNNIIFILHNFLYDILYRNHSNKFFIFFINYKKMTNIFK